MLVRELLAESAARLFSAGIENSAYEARELFKASYRLDTQELLMQLGREICPGALGFSEPADITECPGDCQGLYEFRSLINQRSLRIPLQHLLGYTYFMGLRFSVSPDVLIPRQDTEVLIETVLDCEKEKDLSVLDLGTGSGCIAVSLKKLGGYRLVAASDTDRGALGVAAANARDLDADIFFYESDLFSDIHDSFDIIVSNPPYIPSDVIGTLEPEVREHDPHAALDGGPDGLLFYRRIARGIQPPGGVLKDGGRIYMETGFDQAEAVSDMLGAAGFYNIRIVKDLAGLDRVVTGRKPCSE